MCDILIDSIKILSPLDELDYITKERNHPVLYFYCFLLSYVSYETFSDWFRNQNDSIKSFFRSLHFIIGKVEDKELKISAYSSILRIISFIAKKKNSDGITEATTIVYHFLCIDLPLVFIGPLIDAFSKMVENCYADLINLSNPALARHLIKMFEISYLIPEEVSNFIKTLYEADKAHYGNTLRSQAIINRAAYSSSSLNSFKNLPGLQPQVSATVEVLDKIRTMKKSKLNDENFAELIQKEAQLMFPSPDATIECLNELIEFYHSNEYFVEELQALLLQESIVLEFLAAQKKIDIGYMNIEHPSQLFADICPACLDFICPEGGGFVAKSYCDSPLFSERSLISHILHVIKRSQETNYEEFGIALIDLIWPILEHRDNLCLLSKTFTTFSDCYRHIDNITSDTDRIFGHYFRVCFYGSVFGEEAGWSFIYIEKKLASYFEITGRLSDYYSEKFRPAKIEIINENGEVDIGRLDPAKGYIQVTSVQPYLSKKDRKARTTPFEKAHFVQSFYFDTTYVKGGTNDQSLISRQWLRKTVMTAELPLPSIVKRARITKSEEVEFAPIRAAYRQIRNKMSLLEGAIQRSDFKEIQRILFNLLLEGADAGPLQVAQAFLADGYSLEKELFKYKEKLKSALKELLVVCQKGVDLHLKFACESSTAAIQSEFESRLSFLQKKFNDFI